MRYQYQVIMADISEVNTQCNKMGQQGWELVTAYPSARSNCCNQTVSTIVLIFKSPA